MVTLLVLILGGTTRVQSEAISNFQANPIPAIDWNDGTTTSMSINDSKHKLTTSGDTDQVQLSNFTDKFDDISSIQYEDESKQDIDYLHSEQNYLSKSARDIDSSVATTDWDENSSKIANDQKQSVTLNIDQEDDNKEIYTLNYNSTDTKLSGYIQDIPTLRSIFNSSMQLATTSPKINTDPFLSKATTISDSMGAESSILILSLLDNDEFIPFLPNEKPQDIQPIRTTSRGISPLRRRPRNRIKAIEMSSVITTRPLRRPGKTLIQEPHSTNTHQLSKSKFNSSEEDTAKSSTPRPNNGMPRIFRERFDGTIASASVSDTTSSPTDREPFAHSSETVTIQKYLQPRSIIPAEYMWHSYMIPLDPAAILANDSVVSMFDFINISNTTDSELDDGDTLFLPYGIIDTSFSFPEIVDDNKSNNWASTNGNIFNSKPGVADSLHEDTSFVNFIFPMLDQATEASSLAIDWHDLPSSNPKAGQAAPSSFAEYVAAYASAMQHDETSVPPTETSTEYPKNERQSFRVINLDEHDNPHVVEDDLSRQQVKQYQDDEQHQGYHPPKEHTVQHHQPSRPKQHKEYVRQPNRPKGRNYIPSQIPAKHIDVSLTTGDDKYETPSETAFHHLRATSLPRRYPKGPPYYSFKYDVQDLRGNYYGHEEVKDLLKTRGKYYVLLPDGRLQTVTYYANNTGYYPRVVYSDLAKHPELLNRKYKHVLIPKYPSKPRIHIRPTVTPTSSLPGLHHPTILPFKPTLSPIPVTVSTTPNVIHRVHHVPIPPKHDNELYIPNFLSRHWFRTLRPPTVVDGPFPAIQHLRNGFSMPLLNPFNSVFLPKTPINAVHITSTALPPHPLSPPSLGSTTPLPIAPPTPLFPITTPIPPYLPTSPPISIPHIIPPPHVPTYAPIKIPPTTPTPSVPPFPTSSVLVTPKSSPRPLPHPNTYKPPNKTTITPTSEPVTPTQLTTTPLHPHFPPPLVHPTLRPILVVTNPTRIHDYHLTATTPIPLPSPSPLPFIPLASPRTPLRIPLQSLTKRPLHSVSTPFPTANPFHPINHYNIPGFRQPRFHPHRPLAPTTDHLGPHHILPFNPILFHSNLYPGEITGKHQLVGYLNAEQVILTNPRIHFFHPNNYAHIRPHPVQPSLSSDIHNSFYFPDKSPYHHTHSVAPPAVTVPHSGNKKPGEEDVRTYHLNNKSDETDKSDMPNTKVVSISDEIAEYDEAAKEYL